MVWNASGTVVSEGLTVIGSATIQGQFLVGTSTLAVVNAKVGIGNTNPGATLDIQNGNAVLSDSDVSQPNTTRLPANAWFNATIISGASGGANLVGAMENGTTAEGLRLSEIGRAH